MRNSHNISYTKEKDLMDGDITDEEFEEKYLPFYNNFNDYMKTFVIPICSILSIKWL